MAEEGGVAEGCVELNIISPDSAIDDLRIICPQDWRVSRLKERICEQFPGGPIPRVQKLVYAGKLLEDGWRLDDFLRFEDQCPVFTIHLVCKIQKAESGGGEMRQRRVAEREETVTDDPRMALGGSNLNSWLQYHQQLNTQTQFTQDNLQQMAVMQEMYSQYLEYMQYMQTGVPPLPQPGLQRVVNEGERERAPVLNAGAGGQAFPDEDEEGGNRDILDWLYLSIRVLILLSVVYFYSSFSRLILVAIIALVLYSLQAGLWQGYLQRERDNIQQEVNNIRENGQEEGGDQPANHQAAAEPLRLDPLLVAVNFVTAFFTSIIPDQNQVI